MHELTIVESLLTVVLENAERAQATKVLKINVVVGDLAGVVDDSVVFYFNFLSEKTIAAGARLVFTHAPARLRCRACDIIFSPEKLDFHCPTCKEQQVDVIGGRELYVDSLEVE
ncbi:MAG: hydrogenase maturation nickel metallochaperone HypA [Syntrophorhabdales bacterium]|jgi:hydrogenase nickel incorporation protein HypA/HybF